MVAGNLWAPESSPLTGHRCRHPCALLFWAAALSSHLLLLPKHLHPSSQAAESLLLQRQKRHQQCPPQQTPAKNPGGKRHSARRARTPQACPGNDAQVQVALTFCGRGTFLPAALATGHPGAALFQAGAWGTASRGSYKGSRHLAVATGTHAPAWEPALAAGTRGLWRYWFHPGSHLRSLHLPPCPHVSLENPSPWRTANHPMTQANDRAIDPRSMDMFTRMTYALTKSKRARDQGRKRLRSILEDSAQPWRWLTLGPQQSGSRPARSLSSSASRLWKSGRPRLPGRARSY